MSASGCATGAIISVACAGAMILTNVPGAIPAADAARCASNALPPRNTCGQTGAPAQSAVISPTRVRWCGLCRQPRAQSPSLGWSEPRNSRRDNRPTYRVHCLVAGRANADREPVGCFRSRQHGRDPVGNLDPGAPATSATFAGEWFLLKNSFTGIRRRPPSTWRVLPTGSRPC